MLWYVRQSGMCDRMSRDILCHERHVTSNDTSSRATLCRVKYVNLNKIYTIWRASAINFQRLPQPTYRIHSNIPPLESHIPQHTFARPYTL